MSVVTQQPLFIGAASAQATSVSLSGINIAAGDKIIVCAYRTATTAPTQATGFTSVANTSGNSNSMRVGWKAATGSGDTSGTWTNATYVMVVVYRNCNIGIGTARNAASASSTSVPQITSAQMLDPAGNQWVLAFQGSVQTTSMGVPAGMTGRSTFTGSTAIVQASDTNAAAGTSFTSVSGANGTNAVNAAVSVELIPTGDPYEVQTAVGGTAPTTSYTLGTFTKSTTTGNAIIVLVTSDAGTTSVTDGTNTYTKAVTKSSAGPIVDIWYAYNITGGASVQITINQTSGQGAGIAYEIAGLATTFDPLDQTANASGANGTTVATGATATLAQANEFVMAAAASSTSVLTVGTGFFQFLSEAASTSFLWSEYKSVASTAGVTGTFAAGGSQGSWAVVAATFKLAISDSPPKFLQQAVNRAGNY